MSTFTLSGACDDVAAKGAAIGTCCTDATMLKPPTSATSTRATNTDFQ